MNRIGAAIEARRKAIGLSRRGLADLVGVSSQTILNLEHDSSYNLGTRMMRRLESALNAEFNITLTEKTTMNERICMGNDEFILHIRKHHACDLSNPLLGRRIWRWLRDNADGEQVSGQQAALWGESIAAVASTNLPGSATQFEFRLEALPALYRFLGTLGGGGDVNGDDDEEDE